MSKSGKKETSIILLRLMVFMSVFLIVACSKADTEDTNKEVITKVLEHQFTGPDEKFMDLLWNPKYRTVVNNKEENLELDKYIAEVYGPYFTDSGLDFFMGTFGTSYPSYAFDNGYKLSLNDVTIEQSEKIAYIYTFKADVSYQNSKNEEKTSSVEGEINFSTKEEGKIERFQYLKDNGLSDMLKTTN